MERRVQFEDEQMLQQRRPRHRSNTTTTTESLNERGTIINTGDEKLDVTVENFNVIQRRHLSNLTNHQEGKSLKINESLSGVNLRPSEKSYKEQITSFEQEHAKLNLVEKPNTHDFYCLNCNDFHCPNCNACIKRFILREGEREEERGTSCLGILILIGSIFKGKKPEVEQGSIFKGKKPEVEQVEPGLGHGNILPEIPTVNVVRSGLWQGSCFTTESRTREENILPEIPMDGVVQPGLWEVESETGQSNILPKTPTDGVVRPGLWQVNILALGLATLIGGLFVTDRNLRELKNDTSKKLKNDDSGDQHEDLLGQRGNFWLHATVVVLSFLVFGLVPLVTYGFSFLKSDNRDLKLAAVVPTSVLCIALLAIGKAYSKRPTEFSPYIKIVLYYVSAAALAVSGASYIVGDLFKKDLEKLGWFESSVFVTLSRMAKSAWGSY